MAEGRESPPFSADESVEIRHAGPGYRLRPHGPDAYLQERLIDGEWQPFCRYDLRPAGAKARELAYQRHQAAGETWVVGHLTLVRCTRAAVYRLRDDELVTHTEEGKHTERIVDGAGFRRVAAEVFGLPGLPIEAAIVALEEIKRSRR